MQTGTPERAPGAASEPDGGREFGLCLGAAAALLLATVLSEARASVGVGLIVLLAVPFAVGWISGILRGLVVAGICELMLIGFVQVGLGRLVFERSDLPQLVLLCAAAMTGAVAPVVRGALRRRRRRRRSVDLAPVLPLPRRSRQPVPRGEAADDDVTPAALP